MRTCNFAVYELALDAKGVEKRNAMILLILF